MIFGAPYGARDHYATGSSEFEPEARIPYTLYETVPTEIPGIGTLSWDWKPCDTLDPWDFWDWKSNS